MNSHIRRPLQGSTGVGDVICPLPLLLSSPWPDFPPIMDPPPCAFCVPAPGTPPGPPGTSLFLTSFPNPSKTSLMPLLDAKNEPKASKMTPKWSQNESLVGIKKTLRHHLDKKVPTSTKPHYLLCFVKIHHLFKPLNFDAFWFPKPIKSDENPDLQLNH